MRAKHLRILTYNIHKGFTSGHREFVLHKMRYAIRRVHADLVFLQEVLGEHEVHRKLHPSWPENSQFEFLAEEIWPHHTYGKNAVYDAGHHGNAILSKYPIVFSENIDVSSHRFEHRGLLHAKIELPDQERYFHGICVHLGLREADREFQTRKICERIQSHVPHHEPVVIAGDFNDWRARATPVLKEVLKAREVFQELQGDHAKTFPTWFYSRSIYLKLDRIYYRGLTPKKAEVLTGEPWHSLSDHAALYAELAMNLEKE